MKKKVKGRAWGKKGAEGSAGQEIPRGYGEVPSEGGRAEGI